MTSSLVGSEMCIRDRFLGHYRTQPMDVSGRKLWVKQSATEAERERTKDIRGALRVLLCNKEMVEGREAKLDLDSCYRSKKIWLSDVCIWTATGGFNFDRDFVGVNKRGVQEQIAREEAGGASRA
eukprot:7739058-Prorocentrum_lima.AAC.1